MLIKRFAVMLFAIFSVAAYPEAQPQEQTAQTKATPKAATIGSENLPLTVKIVPGESAAKRAAEEEEHRKEKAHEDTKIADATVILAFVTTLLAIFTGGLWYATYKLARDSKDAGRRQAQEMRESLDVGRRTADAAAKSAKVAEETLVNLERPYIYVTDVSLIEQDSEGFFVPYTVRNNGRTTAEIENVCLEVVQSSDPFPNSLLQAELNHPIFVKRMMAPNAEHRIEERFPDGILCKRYSNGVAPIGDGSGDDLFFIIQINYHGPLGKKYQTVACWRFDDATVSFVRHGEQTNYAQ